MDHRAIELKIKEEDISVMYIIQHEILKDKNTEFAGVVLKHALIRDYVMRIISKSGSSMSILNKSLESAAEFFGRDQRNVKRRVQKGRGG